MIIHFKMFEDNFYQEDFWYFEIAVNDYSSIKQYQALSFLDTFDKVVKYCKTLIEVLNSKNINFRTYTNQVNQENVDGIIFLFKNEKDIPDFIRSHKLNISHDIYKRRWEGTEIPDNDLDLYFNAKKFGL